MQMTVLNISFSCFVGMRLPGSNGADVDHGVFMLDKLVFCLAILISAAFSGFLVGSLSGSPSAPGLTI